MGDLLELAGLPEHDHWVLGPMSEDPYPPERTLAELGVDDGALLILREPTGKARRAARAPRPSA